MTTTICNEHNICENLKSRLVDRGRGFYPKEASVELLGVAYKETKKDKGLMVNYCPWCGRTPGTFKKYVSARH
jgi:hypothetical protein